MTYDNKKNDSFSITKMTPFSKTLPFRHSNSGRVYQILEMCQKVDAMQIKIGLISRSTTYPYFMLFKIHLSKIIAAEVIIFSQGILNTIIMFAVF